MKSLNLDNMSNHNSPYYSDKYTDDKFEYRHVHIPREWVKAMPKDRTMTEQEWRELGKFSFQMVSNYADEMETLSFIPVMSVLYFPLSKV